MKYPWLLLAAAACAPQVATTPPAPAPVPALIAPQPERQIGIEGVLQQGGFARGSAPGALTITLDEQDVPLAPDGSFFLAFGRDAAAKGVLSVTYPDGQRLSRNLAIAARAFPEERLPDIQRRFTEDPAFAARRAGELERIRAARAAPGAGSGWRERFRLPAEGRVSGVFGSQRILGENPQAPHSGVDIAGPVGTPIVAPAAGVVVLASPPEFSLEGNLVILDHGLGLYSSFLHLSRVDVAVGDTVRQGDPIGAIGASGRVTGAHLHWGVIWQGVRFDPLALVAAVTTAR